MYRYLSVLFWKQINPGTTVPSLVPVPTLHEERGEVLGHHDGPEGVDSKGFVQTVQANI